jgi:hypothetical protein
MLFTHERDPYLTQTNSGMDVGIFLHPQVTRLGPKIDMN